MRTTLDSPPFPAHISSPAIKKGRQHKRRRGGTGNPFLLPRPLPAPSPRTPTPRNATLKSLQITRSEAEVHRHRRLRGTCRVAPSQVRAESSQLLLLAAPPTAPRPRASPAGPPLVVAYERIHSYVRYSYFTACLSN